MIEVYIGLGVFVAFIIVLAFIFFRIVPPSEAHYVVSPFKSVVCSPDENLRVKGKRSYYAIWSWIPLIGRKVRIMDVTIKELKDTQETYEKNQARYNVSSSLKYRITNVAIAASTFINNAELKEQLLEVVRASVRAVTVKYDVTEARAKKQLMANEIEKEMEDDLNKWGLELINFQLVDFNDTEDSKIISDISRRREAEIEANTKKQVAEKDKDARTKVAEAEQLAKRREIEKDEKIAEREQNKIQRIAEQQKLATEKEFEVIRVKQVKQAEINKQQALIDQNKEKEVEAIIKEKKKLQGEGDRDRDIEIAKGKAAETKEQFLAEAEGLMKKQEALNKFTPAAITALTAELVVAKDQAIGVETAKALEKSDMKVFAGDGEAGKAGFDLGKLISAISVTEPSTADALNNKIARPNDMGLTNLGLMKLSDRAKELEKIKEQELAKEAEKIRDEEVKALKETKKLEREKQRSESENIKEDKKSKITKKLN